MARKLPLPLPDSPPKASISRWGSGRRRRRRPALLFILLGQEAELVDSGGADFVHHRHNIAILGSSVALHVNGLIETSRDHILDLPGDVILGDLGVLQIDRSVSSNRHDNRVILI